MNGRAKALQQLDLMFCDFIKLDAGLKKGTGKAVKSVRAGVDPAVLVGSRFFEGDEHYADIKRSDFTGWTAN